MTHKTSDSKFVEESVCGAKGRITTEMRDRPGVVQSFGVKGVPNLFAVGSRTEDPDDTSKSLSCTQVQSVGRPVYHRHYEVSHTGHMVQDTTPSTLTRKVHFTVSVLVVNHYKGPMVLMRRVVDPPFRGTLGYSKKGCRKGATGSTVVVLGISPRTSTSSDPYPLLSLSRRGTISKTGEE